MSEKIIGRNAVLEALRNRREIEKLIIARGAEGSVKKIEGKAKDMKIPVYYSERSRMDKEADGLVHQGVIAYAADFEYSSVDDILRLAGERGEDPFIFILDGIEDPHNLGAIMRSGECAGVHGIIIPKRRAVCVNETVSKTSAGASEYMKCARVTNIARTVEELKEKGVWVCACDMDGATMYDQNLKGPLAIVVGGEGQGVSRLVKEKCDFVVSLPMKGRISSLNASGAATALMYEALRQRGI